ncbi:hypothetical protein AALP_AA6G242800 [Arabis alpina]|uniref:Uncharacterized protein n=1 Tax=Arabis alpina TaxID=50452 RepID=A0A087GRE3_ARAAL|nr:hypothetical protein AALP_AA6G242800 [Arabis alpina]
MATYTSQFSPELGFPSCFRFLILVSISSSKDGSKMLLSGLK